MVRASALRALEGDPEWIRSIVDLLDAVDGYVPVPERERDEPFLMPIENVPSISGRGTAVTGAIERGTLRIGEPVDIVGLGPTLSTVVNGLETFGKPLAQAAGLTRGAGLYGRWARPSALQPASRPGNHSERRSGRCSRGPRPVRSMVMSDVLAVEGGTQPRVHCWLAPPVQVQICSRVPSADDTPVASRHLPELVLMSCVPLTVHDWAPVPLQS